MNELDQLHARIDGLNAELAMARGTIEWLEEQVRKAQEQLREQSDREP